MARVPRTNRLSPRAELADLPLGAIQISVTKSERRPVILSENLEPYKLFSFLAKGRVTSKKPWYRLALVHAEKEYAKIEMKGSYIYTAIGEIVMGTTKDSNLKQHPLDFQSVLMNVWSFIVHVDGALNEIEVIFNDKEIFRAQFPYSDFQIWEEQNASVIVLETYVTAGIPHPAYVQFTKLAPFVDAFVRLDVGDSASILGEHKDNESAT
ncbi:uncharacterized protein LOC144094950 isoform X2 [Amblyomma americanum]